MQCQTNPEGNCMMEPHCPPGQCYLNDVLTQEHEAAVGPIVEDVTLARYLIGASLPYDHSPRTEGEHWERTKIGLLNAVLDTLVPGARLIVETDESTGEPTRVALGRGQAQNRPRDLAASLRELARCLDGQDA
ncbi:hypothetical protein BH23PLA1_BH23PLA1_37210 [soil metagenome]